MAELQQRIVQLRSATGEIFEVDEAVASSQSQFLKNVIEDVGVDSPIPLPNVSSDTLRQVLDFCKWYVKNLNPTPTKDEDLQLPEAPEEDDFKVLDYCNCNVKNLNPRNDEDLQLEALGEDDFHEWQSVDAELVKLVDMDTLYDLIMVANYMHIESLLRSIYCTIARMITERTLGEIPQLFTFTHDVAIGESEPHLIGKESQILASFMKSLPTELQLEIKIKVAQRFHCGEWSSWRYDVDAKRLFVKLAHLYDAYNMHQQIAIILLLIDINLVHTLVLQTLYMRSFSPHQSGGAYIEWVDQMDMDLFKDLIDGIDMLKIENLIFDEETIY